MNKATKRLFEMDGEASEELEVEKGTILDTDIGPVVVTAADEEKGICVIANTEDETLVVSAEELAELSPVVLEMSKEEIADLLAEKEVPEEEVPEEE